MSGFANINGLLQGIGTVTVFVAFIGICAWAYSGKRKSGFDEAALLPFRDDELFDNGDNNRAINHNNDNSPIGKRQGEQ